ncbi:MAG: exodeoxyribonuclease VII large subunit [Eubacteriales bacterium]|nr:exodeoxyribonuclease VII large subunit [Eubacteriales bacterium]
MAVFSVNQINNYIKNLLARDFVLPNVTVSGEISNCKYHPAGHIYFTLKDDLSQINCVMFQSNRQRLTFRMQDGQQIEATGSVQVYEKNGTYQLYVRNASLSGQGELFERFLRLKEELGERGLFDEGYKKPIPRYAQRIGIVTAETGAAIRDIVNVSTRRNPYVELILRPALVQGEAAAADIAAAIAELDAMGLDTIIVGRGGGSIEDLWAFNEEIVAEAIFNANTPIISAVGHETDFTIADFVSDLRAPTPSAAAELANFDFYALNEQFAYYENRLDGLMDIKLRMLRERTRTLEARLNSLSPAEKVRRLKEKLGNYEKLIERAIDHKLGITRNYLRALAGRLDAGSPLKKISGGFGYLTVNNKAVRSVDEVSTGSTVVTYLNDGKILSTVTEILKEKQNEG